MRRGLLLLCALTLLPVGCASIDKSRSLSDLAVERRETAFDESARLLVRTASLTLEVESIEDVRRHVEARVDAAKGYVEQAHVGDDFASLSCRVPEGDLDAIVGELAMLGVVQSQGISATDVTEQHADLSTRLRNSEALRERLVKLLASAQTVEELLAVEKELARVQTEIETLTGRRDRLDAQVAMASLHVSLNRRQALGPLGYLAYGLWWGLSKLFVLD